MEESDYDKMRKDSNLKRKEEYNRYIKQKVGFKNCQIYRLLIHMITLVLIT